jgi:hypothetical protein
MKTAHLPSPTKSRKSELLGKLQITKTTSTVTIKTTMIKTTMTIETTMMIRTTITTIRTTITTIRPTTTMTGADLLHHSQIAKIFRYFTGRAFMKQRLQVTGAIHQQ